MFNAAGELGDSTHIVVERQTGRCHWPDKTLCARLTLGEFYIPRCAAVFC